MSHPKYVNQDNVYIDVAKIVSVVPHCDVLDLHIHYNSLLAQLVGDNVLSLVLLPRVIIDYDVQKDHLVCSREHVYILMSVAQVKMHFAG